MRAIADAKERKFIFSSKFAEYIFWKEVDGKEVLLEIQERPSDEMRRYFEGCLVPAMFYWHPKSGWLDFEDARQVLKIQFLPGVRQVKDLDGKTHIVAPSLATTPKGKFQQFVDSITSWMIENGMPPEVIDSEGYKRWRDTDFEGWVYPPLGRLKQSYDEQNAEKENPDAAP